jgi:murein DD-endopeptidase MepM/ murein hydrolase activator NlpD
MRPIRLALLCLAALLAAAAPDAASFGFDGTIVQGGLVSGTAPPGTASLTLDGQPVALAGDGRFILGFDRDQGATALLVATLRDGRAVRAELRVAPRAWQIERIDAPLRPGNAPSAAFLEIRKAELARIGAARAVGASSDGWRQRFIWPVKGRISGVFGSQRIYRGEPGAYHSGLDIAPGAGALVVAPADGIVVLAGPPMFSLEGNLVIIDHGMGLNSAFLHLASTAVHSGQLVKQGQPIGTVGATGRATGPHLHWSMKWREARIDPQMLVADAASADEEAGRR